MSTYNFYLLSIKHNTRVSYLLNRRSPCMDQMCRVSGLLQPLWSREETVDIENKEVRAI